MMCATHVLIMDFTVFEGYVCTNIRLRRAFAVGYTGPHIPMLLTICVCMCIQTSTKGEYAMLAETL